MVKHFHLAQRWDPTGTTTPVQNGPGSNGNEEVLTFVKAPGLEPRHQLQLSVISRTFVGEFLPLRKDGVGVFYGP